MRAPGLRIYPGFKQLPRERVRHSAGSHKSHLYGKLPAMALTGPTDMLPFANRDMQAGADADDDAPGLLSRLIGRDPVQAVAILLIALQIAWRASIGAGGYLSFDDFEFAIRSTESSFTLHYLTSNFNSHVMPGGFAYFWLITHKAGYVYWPYLLLALAGQAVTSYLCFRLLRLMLPVTWGLLIPFTMFLFTPLNMEMTTWFAFSMQMIPQQIAMIWAIAAQVKYVRTGQAKHLASLAGAFLFGAAFTERVLVIVPVVFGVTLFLLVRGSTGRTIWRTVKRYWPSWAVLIGLALPYVIAYQSVAAPESSLNPPVSGAQVATFANQFFFQELIPGLFGGPWDWYDRLPAPGGPRAWISLSALVLLMSATIWRRRIAVRAWFLLASYATATAALVAVTRLGTLGYASIAGLIPRYTSDITLIAAICFGAALFGLRDVPDRRAPQSFSAFGSSAGQTVKAAAIALTAIVFLGGAIVSGSGYAKIWARQPARDYLATVKNELPKIPPGAVFFDRAVPALVMEDFAKPYNKQSRFLSVLDHDLVFVRAAEQPYVFDDAGRVRKAAVTGGVTVSRGNEPNCGHRIRGGGPSVVLPLESELFSWDWVVRIAYISSSDARVEVRLDGKLIDQFTAKPGLHAQHIQIQSAARVLEMQVLTPGADVCTDEIHVGELTPWIE